MAIDRETVAATARLARLTLGEEEIERCATELSAVLDYVARMDELEPPGEARPEGGHEAGAALRADEAEAAECGREELLAQAPQTDGAYFEVPPVVERR